MSGNTLEDAIRDAIQTYVLDCIQRNVPATLDGVVIAIASAVNTYLGRESNEGEKLARREAAVSAIRNAAERYWNSCLIGGSKYRETLDAIVKEAQG